MKKLFFVMAAVAALLTSCSKDDTFGGPTRGKVTFEVSTPELATRYGEGTTATALQYAVYDMVEDATSGKLVDTGTATLDNKRANVSIDLVEGRKYTAIFWADAGENASPYTFTPATKTVSYTDVNDLKANQEAYDAFYAFVPQADIKVGQTVSVTLTRPFAQLRIETSDTDRAKQLGVEVVKTGITVNAYTSFNLETGAVDGQQNITFKPTAKASAPRATVGGADYDLISMNYILANHTNADLVDVTLNFTDDVNGAEENYVRKYSNIDVQRNYRTIVRGTILTDPTEFDVEVKPGFDSDINEDGNTSETLVVSTADEIIDAFENLNNSNNGPTTIVLGDDIDLNDFISLRDNSASLSTMTRAEENSVGLTIGKDKVLTIDLNGYTLFWENGVQNGSMIQNNGNLTINNGNVEYTYSGANDSNYGKGNYAITNHGTLTINANITAKAKNVADKTKFSHALYAINNMSGVTTINGGKIYNPNNVAIRQWISSESVSSDIIVNGGEIEGVRAIWMHLPSSNNTAPLGNLTVNGGTLTSYDTEYNLAVYVYSYGQLGKNVNVKIGGNAVINGNVAYNASATGVNIEVTGGTFNSDYGVYGYGEVEDGAKDITIKGGEFSTLYPLQYLNSADEVLTLGADMTASETITFSGIGAIDLNGHTISGVNNAGQGHLIMVKNGASLTIKDSSADESGKITYAKGSSDTGWTIDLEGELNLESGTIELTGDNWSIGYAVDVRPNAWGTAYTSPTTFNMKGGKLVSSDGAVRVASSSSESYSDVSANFNMTDGEIKAAWDGIFIQQSNATYDVLTVNISGGKIESTDLYPVRLYGPVATGKVGDSSLKISGGTFVKANVENRTELVDGLICIGGGIGLEDIYHTKIEITGGTFDGGEALTSYTYELKTPASAE